MHPAVRVKICGMKTAEDIEIAVACGADSVGFITDVFIPTPRNLDINRVSELVKIVPESV
jgi:phosphoribosylanthranilate isomerase